MKKILCTTITLLLLAAMLTGCTNKAADREEASDPATEAAVPAAEETAEPAPTAAPEATPALTDMQRLYEAVQEASDLIGYISEYDAITLTYTGSADEANAAVAALNAAAAGQPVRIMTKDRELEQYDQYVILYEAMANLTCEVSLIDYYLWQYSGYSAIKNMHNLVSLTVLNGSVSGDFTSCTALRSVTMDVYGGDDSVQLGFLATLPALESFTLHIAEGASVYNVYDPYVLANIPTLRTVEVQGSTEGEWKLPLLVMCQAAASAPAIESVCGETSYDAAKELGDGERAAFERLCAERFCQYEKKVLGDGGYTEGGIDPGGKTMVYVIDGYDAFHDSFDVEVADDYYGVSPEMFTLDPAACTRIILVYAVYEKVGSYTNGMNANKTHTTVAVLDPVNRTVCLSKVVASTNPPS